MTAVFEYGVPDHPRWLLTPMLRVNALHLKTVEGAGTGGEEEEGGNGDVVLPPEGSQIGGHTGSEDHARRVECICHIVFPNHPA